MGYSAGSQSSGGTASISRTGVRATFTSITTGEYKIEYFIGGYGRAKRGGAARKGSCNLISQYCCEYPLRKIHLCSFRRFRMTLMHLL